MIRNTLDRALAAATRRAGAPGRIRYTERQLYFELCRVLQPMHRLPRRPLFTLPAPVRYDRYVGALRRHDVSGLLAATPRRTATPPPEVFDYGLPRVLVCQDAAIAAMLLANDLHMESACPVFAVADLPLDRRLAEAVRRAEEGTVYVLHDASVVGLRSVERVREWAGDLRVRPLGLRPVHAAALHLTRGTAKAGNVDLPVAADLTPWESRWLRSGHAAEIAAVNPARLLRTVHRLVRNQSRVRPPRPRLRELQATSFLTWPGPGGSP